MSQEKAAKTLEGLGFTPLDARVYVFLAKRGPQKAGDVAKSLKMPKQTVYFILKNLQKGGIITSTVERPARFGVVPFERVLDLFVKARLEEAHQLQRKKTEILSDWQSIAMPETFERSPKFTVIQGRSTIYAKIQQMIHLTRKYVSVVTTVPNLARAELFGLFDSAFEHQDKGNLHFRLLTELSERNLDSVRGLLSRASKQDVDFEIRVPDLGLRLLNQMVIKDDEEAVFFINGGYSGEEQDNLCLWTDCIDLVRSFGAVFEDIWESSASLREKMAEIETGKPSPRTIVFKDAVGANRRYEETVRSAESSIFMLTSSKGLVDCCQDKNQADAWVRKGVSVRIMAPIDDENLDVARKLMEVFEVRHVPAGYLGTTIVDGRHLFQFKTPVSEGLDSVSHFENTIYTSDSEFIDKTESMLKHLWENSQVPSSVALKAVGQSPQKQSEPAGFGKLDDHVKAVSKIVGLTYIMEPQFGRITEKEVIDKIASAKRVPARNPESDTIWVYGSMGTAIIYPPKNLDLPNFIIQVSDYNRKSSFGAGSSLFFYVETQIAGQQAYLPAVFITDNPRGYKFRKAMHNNRESTERVYFAKKGELEVQAGNNRLFAAWAVPISLLPPKYVLPPGCLIFEGFGKIRSYSSEVEGPMKRRVRYECNTLAAFVNYMHPSLKYNGPASDGLLRREVIMTSYPPSIPSAS